ncbi:MAG: hypothetical protein ACXVFL_10905 [Solirubrobacteraceae bacterium]
MKSGASDRKGKLRTVALTIASGKASLAPGKSKTIKAKLNRKGTSLLRHKKRLKTAVVLTQTAGGKKTATTKSLTIKVRNLKK